MAIVVQAQDTHCFNHLDIDDDISPSRYYFHLLSWEARLCYDFLSFCGLRFVSFFQSLHACNCENLPQPKDLELRTSWTGISGQCLSWAIMGPRLSGHGGTLE
jgi:hypothetical protein